MVGMDAKTASTEPQARFVADVEHVLAVQNNGWVDLLSTAATPSGRCSGQTYTVAAAHRQISLLPNIQDQPVDILDNFPVSRFPVKLLFRFGMNNPARFTYIGD
jgi:hypothetical protein